MYDDVDLPLLELLLLLMMMMLERTPLEGVTAGSAAARRVTTLGRAIMLLRIVVPLLAVAGTGAGESLLVLGDTPPPLGGDAPPDEGPPSAPGKIFDGDAAPGKGAAGVSKFLLVRSRI